MLLDILVNFIAILIGTFLISLGVSVVIVIMGILMIGIKSNPILTAVLVALFLSILISAMQKLGV